MTKLQAKTLTLIRSHVPGFDQLRNGEKLLQANAVVCDYIHVREELGPNHGEYVDDILQEAGGLNPGAPWCAALINWLCEMLKIPNPEVADALVAGWKAWAKKTGRLRTKPKRGYLCGLIHANGSGHIGQAVSVGPDQLRTIEGNTSPGNEGSQRDGDGHYRKVRADDYFDWYIDLD